MKKIAVLLIALSSLFLSCTKSKSTSPGGTTTGGYSCYCFWLSPAQKDTSTTFYYPADTTAANAQANCNYKVLWVQSLSGTTSGAYCTFN